MQRGRRDATAGVFHLDAQRVRQRPSAKGEAVAITVAGHHRLLGVGDQVEDDLLQLVHVQHRHRRRALVEIADHVDAAHVQLVDAQLERVVQHLIDVRGHLLRGSIVSQQDAYVRVGEHEPEPLSRVSGIEWNVCAARLQHGQYRDAHFKTSVEADSDS